MIVRNVNTVCFNPYAAGKIIISPHGGLSDEQYSSESFGRFGKNNKAHRRGIQQDYYRWEIYRRADLYPCGHYRNALPYNGTDIVGKGAGFIGALTAAYGSGTRWLFDNRFIFLPALGRSRLRAEASGREGAERTVTRDRSPFPQQRYAKWKSQ